MGALDKKRHRMLVINVRRLYEAMGFYIDAVAIFKKN